MSESLREQLLRAGLVSAKQVKQAEQAARQKTRQKHEPATAAQTQGGRQQAQAAKVARDRELDRARQEARARQARFAEIRQIVEQHRIPRLESDDHFNFLHAGKIRRIAVDAALRQRIVDGQLLIVRCGKYYALVPPDVAERVRERNADSVVDLRAQLAGPSEPADDDPYKEFAVPDDLLW